MLAERIVICVSLRFNRLIVIKCPLDLFVKTYVFNGFYFVSLKCLNFLVHSILHLLMELDTDLLAWLKNFQLNVISKLIKWFYEVNSFFYLISMCTVDFYIDIPIPIKVCLVDKSIQIIICHIKTEFRNCKCWAPFTRAVLMVFRLKWKWWQ